MPFSIRGRIFLTLAPVLALLLVLGVAGVVLLWRLGERIDAILRENYDTIIAMERLNDALERIDFSFQFTLAGQEAKARGQYAANWPIYREQLRFEQGNVTVSGEQELVDELTVLTSRYEQQGDAFYARPAMDPARERDYSGPAGLLETFTEIKSVSRQISQINQDNMEQAGQQARQMATASLIGFGIGLAGAVCLAGWTGWYIFHAIIGPIKQAEQALRTSEGNLNRAQAVAHIGSWYLNIPRDELVWSDETYRIFKVPSGAPLTYEQFLAIVHPEDRDRVDRAWTAAMSGAPYDIEHRIQVDGETKWIREKADITLDTTGHALEGIGIAHDITGRKHAEQALRESELRRRVILDSALDGLIVINHDSRVVEFNPAAETIFGYAHQDVIGRSIAELIIPPALREAHHSGLQRYLATGEGPALGKRVEMPALRADGTEFPMELSILPVPDTQPPLFSAFVRDITERKRSEEQLRRSNRALLALSSCNEVLIRATNELALLQEICRIVVEKAGYRLCWVGYAEQDEARTVRPVAQAGFEEGYLKTVNVTWADVECGRGPTGTCIRTGQLSLFKDLDSDPRFAPWRAEARKRGYASCIGIPLVSDSATLGALTIYAAEPNAFSDEEVALLTELTNDLAFGVMTLRTRAERKQAVELQAAHEREVRIGSEIQQTLLVEPLPTDLRGLRVAALSVPSQRIDGDFYSFYRHEDQRLDLIVADVMGKGIPAALLGAATKGHILETLCHLLHASPAGVLPPPKDIVTQAQAAMVQHLIDLESFVTLCYVRFDPDRRTIEFVDAGHTGVIHRHAATGRCDVLHGDNLPLGFRRGEIFNEQSISFAADDLLVLYSDGVTEARNPAGESFGQHRLTQCIQSNNAIEPEDLADAIRDAVFAFVGSESLADDLTCVVVKMVESERPAARAHREIRSDVTELARAREFIRAFCRDLPGSALDEEFVGKIELAVTEACSNIIKYAYRRRTDQQILLAAEAFPERLSIRLHYWGDPFDPSSVPQPRLDGSQESGFGVYLITRSVDAVRYYRDERGRNCIALTKSR